jgi:hypothetical protein
MAKIQTAYLRMTARPGFFFASWHLTIFERPANFEFFNSQIAPLGDARRAGMHVSFPA